MSRQDSKSKASTVSNLMSTRAGRTRQRERATLLIWSGQINREWKERMLGSWGKSRLRCAKSWDPGHASLAHNSPGKEGTQVSLLLFDGPDHQPVGQLGTSPPFPTEPRDMGKWPDMETVMKWPLRALPTFFCLHSVCTLLAFHSHNLPSYTAFQKLSQACEQYGAL